MRISKLLVLVVLTTMALGATATQAFAERTLGLSSGTFLFDVEPGQEASGTVDVMNDGDEPLKVLVYAADQNIDDDGKITYEVPGRDQIKSTELPSAWLTVKMPSDAKAQGNVPYLEIGPGERVPVTFLIDIPEKAVSGDHNVLVFFEMEGGPATTDTASSSVAGRLGARIRLRVEGSISRQMDVRPFVVPSFVIGNKIPYRFTVRNRGNVDERVVATLSLLNRNEETVFEHVAIEPQTVFAGKNLTAKDELGLPRQPFGPQMIALSVTPIADDGSPVDGLSPIEDERSVWVVPLWLVIFAAATIVVALVWLVMVLSQGGRASRSPAPSPRFVESDFHDPNASVGVSVGSPSVDAAPVVESSDS